MTETLIPLDKIRTITELERVQEKVFETIDDQEQAGKAWDNQVEESRAVGPEWINGVWIVTLPEGGFVRRGEEIYRLKQNVDVTVANLFAGWAVSELLADGSVIAFPSMHLTAPAEA